MNPAKLSLEITCFHLDSRGEQYTYFNRGISELGELTSPITCSGGGAALAMYSVRNSLSGFAKNQNGVSTGSVQLQMQDRFKAYSINGYLPQLEWVLINIHRGCDADFSPRVPVSTLDETNHLDELILARGTAIISACKELIKYASKNMRYSKAKFRVKVFDEI